MIDTPLLLLADGCVTYTKQFSFGLMFLSSPLEIITILEHCEANKPVVSLSFAITTLFLRLSSPHCNIAATTNASDSSTEWEQTSIAI